MDLLTRIREEMALEGNVWKSYAYRFLMNFQLWWPIWVIYLQRERGLLQKAGHGCNRDRTPG